MSQHVGPLHISVIGYHESFSHLLAFRVQILQNLNCFRARSSAHIKHFVIRLNFKQSHRNHTHFLLPENSPVFSFCHQKFMETLKRWWLPDFCSPNIVKRKSKLIRIPFDSGGCLWIRNGLVCLDLVDEWLHLIERPFAVFFNRVDSEANVQGIFEFAVEFVPFTLIQNAHGLVVLHKVLIVLFYFPAPSLSLISLVLLLLFHGVAVFPLFLLFLLSQLVLQILPALGFLGFFLLNALCSDFVCFFEYFFPFRNHVFTYLWDFSKQSVKLFYWSSFSNFFLHHGKCLVLFLVRTN